jgi:rod shape-determining protein MreC
MAPPANRRPGYSRRAQFGTFLGYVIGLAGALLGAVFLFAGMANHGAFANWRSTAADVTAAPGRAGAWTRDQAGQILDTVVGFAVSGPENARMKRELALARVRLAGEAAVVDENRRLKALAALAAEQPHAVANGWLIASSATSTRRYAVMSVGRRQGVAPGMPVRTPLGLVGRVVEVGNTTARVLLLSDSESVVPVRRASDGVPAFATGRADGSLQLRLISLGINPLKPGDAFVTSGSGGLYWPNTPVAVVTELTRDGAIARLLSDPAASDLVVVQPQWNPVSDPSLPAPPPPGGPRKGKG